MIYDNNQTSRARFVPGNYSRQGNSLLHWTLGFTSLMRMGEGCDTDPVGGK